MNTLITSNKSGTMSSNDLYEIVCKARAEFNEKQPRLNDFHARVVDELEGEYYESFVVQNPNKTETTFYNLTKDQCTLVGMRESKSVRRRVLEMLKELESKTPALPDFSDPVAAARAWADAKESEQKALIQIEQDKPKVEFYNDVTGSDDTITIGEVAKVLNIKGMGRNKMFAFLRDQGVLRANNEPYQTYIDRGYFRLVESKFQKPNGDTCINIKTVVYQKGLDFISKKIKSTISK